MKTFITGGSGFVGLALAEHLLAGGQDVVGFDLAPPPAAALRAYAGLPGRHVAVQGDVRDAALLRAAMNEHRPDRLVTLAAITADRHRERAAPQSIFDVNVGGVLAAVAAAADCGVARVLHASSGSAYGASGRHPAPMREDGTPLQPEGLYGMSKRAAEEAVRRLATLADLPLVIGRLGTCFGPWEADSGVRDTPSAPMQVLRVARGERGPEKTAILPRDSRRDWLYVRDAAAAIAALLDQPAWKHPLYNLAAGFEWSIGQFCERIAASHSGFSWRLARPGDTANIDYYADYDRASMNIDRLRADTGFVPRFDLDAAAGDFRAWIDGYGEASFKSMAEHV